MKKLFQLVALVSCVSNSMLAYFETNTAQNVLGFVPITIDLGDYIDRLSTADELDLSYFNNVLNRKITLALVECEGTGSHTNFKRLYRSLLLNILFHANWQTKVGLKIRQKRQPIKSAVEELPVKQKDGGDKEPRQKIDEELADEAFLEHKNKEQIDKSQCKLISNAFVSVLQVSGVKQEIDARITKTMIDWLKENQTYLQVSWQLAIWGSAFTEWYFGHSEIIPHLIAHSSTYLRAFFSAAPVAIQAYQTFSRPLNPQELSNMAVRLQTMVPIRVKLADNAKLGHDLSERSLLVDSLQTRDPGMVYARYLRLKKLLISLVESNPVAIFDEDLKAWGWQRGSQSYDQSQIPIATQFNASYNDDEQQSENFSHRTYDSNQIPQYYQSQKYPRHGLANHRDANY